MLFFQITNQANDNVSALVKGDNPKNAIEKFLGIGENGSIEHIEPTNETTGITEFTLENGSVLLVKPFMILF